MKKSIFTILIIQAIAAATFSQSPCTYKGRAITMHDSGTWEYADTVPAPDMTLGRKPADCAYTMNEVDAFSGVTKMVTKERRLAERGGVRLLFFCGRVNDQFLIYFRHSADLGCVTSKSFVMIKFTDGTIIEMRHMGKTDCSDYAYVSCVATDHMPELLNKPISMIRVSAEKYDDFTVTGGMTIANDLNCLQ